jgi:hypothetical protein
MNAPGKPGPPRRTPEELEPLWIRAYDLWSKGGQDYTQVGATMGVHRDTAKRYVLNGQQLVAEKGDPLRKARARREMTVDALHAQRAELRADADAGLISREAMHKLYQAALEKAARIGGYEAPRPTSRVHVSGNAAPASVDPALLGALAAIPRDELDALLDGMLPDGRTGS